MSIYWWLGLGTVIMDRYPFGNARNPQLRPSSSFPIAMGFPNANFDDEGDEVLCECTFWCSAGALWTVCGRSPPCQQPSKKQEQYCKTFIRRGVLNSRERVNYGSRNFQRCLGQAVIFDSSAFHQCGVENIQASFWAAVIFDGSWNAQCRNFRRCTPSLHLRDPAINTGFAVIH